MPQKKSIRTSWLLILPVFLAGWLGGCSTEKKPPATAIKPVAQHKPSRHYFNPPLAEDRGHYPSFPRGARSVDDVLFSVGPYALDQIKPYFRKAGVEYPPRELILLAIKDERKMELWARDEGKFRFIRDYGIRAASGMRGPKLKQGDRQVPEGIYHISRLNPNSNYHLSMKVDYPNDFDLDHAEDDGRTDLGGDIFIHGKSVSAGCLAMGDAAIEELFVLAAHVGTRNIEVIIAPSDPRKAPLETRHPSLPDWTPELYQSITQRIMTVTGARPPIRLAHSSPHHPMYRAAN